MSRTPVGETPDLPGLVGAARRGDGRAWSALVRRLLPLVRVVARGHRLNDADVEDVGQTVCLTLFEHLDRIREPEALPAWIITTARRESLQTIRRRGRLHLVDPLDHTAFDSVDDRIDVDAKPGRAHLPRALRDGLADLPRLQRELLLLLTDDQSRDYREIGRMLAMPVGSIGPTRARGLARLRTTTAIRDYLAATGSEALERSA